MRPPDATALSAELEHTKRVLATKLAELRKFQTERETLIARIAERDTRIRELEATGITDAALALQSSDVERDRERAASQARLRDIEARLADREVQAQRLEAELARSQARAHELEARVAERDARVAERDARLEDRETRIASLEQEIQESLGWAAPPSEDLKKIRGIGPKFEQHLHGAGVRSFAQIAAWSSADVERFAAELRIQPARIQREGWIEAARALAKR